MKNTNLIDLLAQLSGCFTCEDILDITNNSPKEYEQKLSFLEQFFMDLEDEGILVSINKNGVDCYVHINLYNRAVRNDKIDELLANQNM